MKKSIFIVMLVISAFGILFFGVKLFSSYKVKDDAFVVQKSETNQASTGVGISSSTGSKSITLPELNNNIIVKSRITSSGGSQENVNTNAYNSLIANFEKIKTDQQYSKFSISHPKEWIYVYAIRNKRKDLWSSVWSYEFDANNLVSPFSKNKEQFMAYLNSFYDNVVSGKNINYTVGQDLTIFFSSSQDIKYLEGLCLGEGASGNGDDYVAYCLNILYFAKATPENKLCDKISNKGKEGAQNIQALCYELINPVSQ